MNSEFIESYYSFKQIVILIHTQQGIYFKKYQIYKVTESETGSWFVCTALLNQILGAINLSIVLILIAPSTACCSRARSTCWLYEFCFTTCQVWWLSFCKIILHRSTGEKKYNVSCRPTTDLRKFSLYKLFQSKAHDGTSMASMFLTLIRIQLLLLLILKAQDRPQIRV